MFCERINNILDHYGNLPTKNEDSLWRVVNKQAEVASMLYHTIYMYSKDRSKAVCIIGFCIRWR
jgi:hypothetical protein